MHFWRIKSGQVVHPGPERASNALQFCLCTALLQSPLSTQFGLWTKRANVKVSGIAQSSQTTAWGGFGRWVWKAPWTAPRGPQVVPTEGRQHVSLILTTWILGGSQKLRRGAWSLRQTISFYPLNFSCATQTSHLQRNCPCQHIY